MNSFSVLDDDSERSPVTKQSTGAKRGKAAKLDKKARALPIRFVFKTPSSSSSSRALEAHPNKIFVGGLPFRARAKHLRTAFSAFGRITDAKIVFEDRKSCGYGYVTFSSFNGHDGRASAEKAQREMDGKELMGQRMQVKEYGFTPPARHNNSNDGKTQDHRRNGQDVRGTKYSGPPKNTRKWEDENNTAQAAAVSVAPDSVAASEAITHATAITHVEPPGSNSFQSDGDELKPLNLTKEVNLWTNYAVGITEKSGNLEEAGEAVTALKNEKHDWSLKPAVQAAASPWGSTPLVGMPVTRPMLMPVQKTRPIPMVVQIPSAVSEPPSEQHGGQHSNYHSTAHPKLYSGDSMQNEVERLQSMLSRQESQHRAQIHHFTQLLRDLSENYTNGTLTEGVPGGTVKAVSPLESKGHSIRQKKERLRFDPPPRSVVDESTWRRELVENVLHHPETVSELTRSKDTAIRQNMPIYIDGGNANFGRVGVHASIDSGRLLDAPPYRVRKRHVCFVVDEFAPVVWLDRITLYPPKCAAFQSPELSWSLGADAEKHIVDKFQQERLMLMPGTKLTVSVEIDRESMTPGAYFQWIVLSFSCFDPRNRVDYGPNLDKGINIVNSVVRRFSVGAPFRVSMIRMKEKSKKSANNANGGSTIVDSSDSSELALNVGASSFVPKSFRMAFDLKPFLILELVHSATRAGGYAWQTLLDALPESWHSHETYHNTLYQLKRHYSVKKTALEIFEVRAYDLVEELKILLPVVRRVCAPWNARAQSLASDFDMRQTITDYVDAFQTLLSVEQLRHKSDVQKYDLHCTSRPKIVSGAHIRITVPGLSNKRPLIHENMQIRFCLEKDKLLKDLSEKAEKALAKRNREELDSGWNALPKVDTPGQSWEDGEKVNGLELLYQEVVEAISELRKRFESDPEYVRTRPSSWHTAGKNPMVPNFELDQNGDFIQFSGHVVNINVKEETVLVQIPSLCTEDAMTTTAAVTEKISKINDLDNIFGGLLSNYFERLGNSLVDDVDGLHVRFMSPTKDHFTAMQVAVHYCAQELSSVLFKPPSKSLPEWNPMPTPGSASTIGGKFHDETQRLQARIAATSWIDPGLNTQQKMAIAAIFCKWDPTSQPTTSQRPLCVIGPAGTGKTRALTEAVLQLSLPDKVHLNFPQDLSKKKSGLLILVTAPTDVAADVICARLASKSAPLFDTEGRIMFSDDGSAQMRMLRLNAVTRPRKFVVMNETLKYCLISDRDRFKLPGMTAIHTVLRRGDSVVVVSTCAMAAYLFVESKVNTSPSGFDYVFVDEAAQAVEAETLVSVSCAKVKAPRVVLFGDPKQLGPQIRSPVARAQGLGVSFLERLAQEQLHKWKDASYQTLPDPRSLRYSPLLAIELNINYRSHVDILSLSNELFYENRLLSAADPCDVDSLQAYIPHEVNVGSPFPPSGAALFSPAPGNMDFKTPTNQSPLWVVGVNGQDAHDIDSPSFFNTKEVDAVCSIVLDLLQSKVVSVSPTDFGVIAPYWQQVRNIRVALRNLGLSTVRVGLVEDYQGQESRITIVSMTLSRVRESLSSLSAANVTDGSGNGILGSAKGFNVATSRAKALSIIIGNPVALEGDIFGRSLLLRALRSNRYVGTPCSRDILRDAQLQTKGNCGVRADGQPLQATPVDIVDHLGEFALALAIEQDQAAESDGVDATWVPPPSIPLFSWEELVEEDGEEEEFINSDLARLGGGYAGHNAAMSDLAAYYGQQSFESKFA